MCCRRARRQRDSEHEIAPARSSRDQFYPKGRKGGGVVRIQTDYSRGGRLLRYSLALIDTQKTGIDGGRVEPPRVFRRAPGLGQAAMARPSC